MNGFARKALTIGLALGGMSAAHANSFYVGTLRPYFYGNNLYIEETNVQKGAVPACATRPLLRLSADPASPEYKAQYAMLLAAWYTGRPLSIAGNNTCSTEGDEIILSISPQ